MALHDLGNVKGAKGDTGAQGPKGDKGATGASGTVSVGTTTTGAAGTAASVTNTGTPSAGVFNFTIPRGADGREFGETFSNLANVQCADSVMTDLCSIAVPKGTYVIIAKAIFQLSSATGSRKLYVAMSNGYGTDATEVGGNGNGYTQIENSDIVTVSGTTVVTARAQQSSGQTVTVTGIIRAIKISD